MSLKKPFPRLPAGTSLKKGRSSEFENLLLNEYVYNLCVMNLVICKSRGLLGCPIFKGMIRQLTEVGFKNYTGHTNSIKITAIWKSRYPDWKWKLLELNTLLSGHATSKSRS